MDELETNISSINVDIEVLTLQTVSMNMFDHGRLCIKYGGANFQKFL
jgi:hypothetical protein